MNKAAIRPVSVLPFIYLVILQPKKQVRQENTGAVKTHICLISIGINNNSNMFFTITVVYIKPGNIVCPTNRPKGYQDSESNQY